MDGVTKLELRGGIQNRWSAPHPHPKAARTYKPCLASRLFQTLWGGVATIMFIKPGTSKLSGPWTLIRNIFSFMDP